MNLHILQFLHPVILMNQTFYATHGRLISNDECK